jgi:phage tail-like protein
MADWLNQRDSLVTDPVRNFRFLVRFLPQGNADDIKFVNTVGFTQVSGLNVAVQSIPYREGSMNTTVHQIPGQAAFSPVTLQRGMVLGSKQNWNWMKSLFSTVSGNGTRATGTSFRCDVEIAVLDHPAVSGGAQRLERTYSGHGTDDYSGWEGTVNRAMLIRLYNAWITSLAYSDLNAGDNAFLVEQITLVHEGMDITFAGDVNANAPAPYAP